MGGIAGAFSVIFVGIFTNYIQAFLLVIFMAFLAEVVTGVFRYLVGRFHGIFTEI